LWAIVAWVERDWLVVLSELKILWMIIVVGFEVLFVVVISVGVMSLLGFTNNKLLRLTRQTALYWLSLCDEHIEGRMYYVE
jgi:hypothetical protein